MTEWTGAIIVGSVWLGFVIFALGANYGRRKRKADADPQIPASFPVQTTGKGREAWHGRDTTEKRARAHSCHAEPKKCIVCGCPSDMVVTIEAQAVRTPEETSFNLVGLCSPCCESLSPGYEKLKRILAVMFFMMRNDLHLRQKPQTPPAIPIMDNKSLAAGDRE